MALRDSIFRSPALHRAVCEKVRIGLRQHLSTMAFVRNHADVACHIDPITQDMVLELESYVLSHSDGRVDVEEKWPADWWQAVRERWAPVWWLKRWPVRHKTVSVHREVWRVCPHLDITTPAQQRHVEFLMQVPQASVHG